MDIFQRTYFEAYALSDNIQGNRGKIRKRKGRMLAPRPDARAAREDDAQACAEPEWLPKNEF